MVLELYNTRTRRKEAFASQTPNHAKIYVCGPTVYDYAHLGHARCYVVYDVLVRHLRANDWKVTYVRNITDVDDKIIKRASQTGRDPIDLAREFTEAYHTDMAQLAVLPADIEPRVSSHIPETIALIQTLIEKEFAYVSEGDVYFSVPRFETYGKLSGRKFEDSAVGGSGRVAAGELARKRHPADFALWKSASQNELGWQSPWGRGRPGWHIECSTMSMQYLGETLDLHGGGLDLVFPHHENEIAQSEAATGQLFSNFWLHNGFVEVSKEKMSKSLGNFFTIREMLKFAEAEAIRYFVLTVHYRAPLNLDWDVDADGAVKGFPGIEDAERRIEYLYRTKERVAGIGAKKIVAGSGSVAVRVDSLTEQLSRCLDDDLNTPEALACVAEFLKNANDIADKLKPKAATLSEKDYGRLKDGFDALEARLGLGGQDAAEVLQRIQQRRLTSAGVSEERVQALIDERNAARKQKDYARADAIRQQLTEMRIELLDTPDGTNWRIL